MLDGWSLNDTIYGGDNNDQIDGKGGDDVLVGGAGIDILRGNSGNDTYIWSTSDGNDSIRDNPANTTEIDKLILTDVSSNGVELRRKEDSAHLDITILNTGEIIEIQNRFKNGEDGRGIEEIHFSDGVVWDLTDIRANTVLEDTVGGVIVDGTDYIDNLFGLDGNDTIKAGTGDDHLTGGVGNDTLYGEAGNDTYIWQSGDGSDEIIDVGIATASDCIPQIASAGSHLVREWNGRTYQVEVLAKGYSS